MSSNTKIALFVPTLGGGGAERIMVHLANAFAERNLKVDLVLVRAEGEYIDEVKSEVRVVDLGAHRILASLPRLIRYLHSERPDSLLSTLTYANCVAILARRAAGYPSQLVVREANSIVALREHATSLRERLVPLVVEHVYPGADVAVGVSRGVAQDLVKSAGLRAEMVRAIYSPVVTDDLREKAQESVEHPWFTQPESIVVLGAGRLTEQKDFGTLIRAFAIVREQIDARLMILGEGEGRSDLEELVDELDLHGNVELPGFVENPFRYMARSDVFVLSSRYEGLPGVLIQALATGCPVVSTNCPYGPSEILEDGHWGSLVPVQDEVAMAEAITEVVCTKPDMRLLQMRSQDFSVKQSVDRYLKVLTSQANTAPSSHISRVTKPVKSLRRECR